MVSLLSARKSHMITIILAANFLCLFAFSAHFAHALETYLVDDFNDGSPQGNAHYFLTEHGTGVTCTEVFDAERGSNVLSIQWSYGGAEKWWYSNTWAPQQPALDATKYSHLTLRIKGQYGGEHFNIQIRDMDEHVYEYEITQIIGDVITNQWKEVHIPLWRFYGPSPEVDLTRVKAVAATFDKYTSGTVYIDDIRFDGCRIDDFENYDVAKNALWKNTYWGDSNITSIDENGYHRISWGGPSWWFTNTESNQPYPCPNPNNFNQLHFRIKGAAGGEKFEIRFQTSPSAYVGINSNDHITITTDWQEVYIPLHYFTDQGVTLNDLYGFAFTFAGTGQTPTGTIYIDDITMENITMPIAYFTADKTSGKSPLTVNFTDTSFQPPGGITSWSWDFGDPASGANNTSTLQNPSHTYEDPDTLTTYTVTLTVTGYGGSDTETKTNYISVSSGYGSCQIGAFIADSAKNATFPWNGEQGILNYEAVIQREVAVIKLYSKIVDKFPYRDCLTISEHGSVAAIPYIDIAPKTQDNGSLPILNDIIDGNFNSDIRNWAEQAKAYGKPLYVCFDGEMNGAWGTPMGSEHVGSGYANGGGTLNGYGDPAKPDGPERYVDAWRHIHDIFEAVGADNVAWVWAVNNFDWPTDSWNEFENYYPGGKYVDWLGVDGYNWNFPEVGWLTFEDVFETALYRLQAISADKPIILAEFGCAQEGVSDPPSYDKSTWITDGFNLLKTTYPYNHVGCFIWFDMDKERNWLIDSDGVAAPRAALADPYFASRGDPGAAPLNLALNKTATASSVEGGTTYYASKAVDGNFTTRWSSIAVDGQWIYVDLGDTYDIGEVVLRWEAAYATRYEIQVSDNASDWTTVYTTPSDSNGGLDAIPINPAISARYVKMKCINRVIPAWGTSLYEFEVYERPSSNLARGKNVVISSRESVYYPGNQAVDCDFGTRWSSAGVPPAEPDPHEYIYVDLGAICDIGQVIIRWEAAYASGYNIQVSDNSTVWTTVYSTSTGDGGDDYITLDPAVTGRYVRLNCTTRGPDFTWGYSLWEFEVIDLEKLFLHYGDPIQGAVAALGGAGTIYLGSGNYDADPVVTIGDNIDIIGQSADTVDIKANIVVVENAFRLSRVTIFYPEGDLINFSSISPPMAILGDSGIIAVNSNISVKDCIIQPDPAIFGTGKYGKGIQIWDLYGSQDINPVIENNLIINADIGVSLFSQALGGEISGEIKNNTFVSNNTGMLLRMHKENPLIKDNIITSSFDGIHIAYQDGTLLNNRIAGITGNVFFGNNHNVWCDEMQAELTPPSPETY